jgi:hypothetical protein
MFLPLLEETAETIIATRNSRCSCCCCIYERGMPEDRSETRLLNFVLRPLFAEYATAQQTTFQQLTNLRFNNLQKR